MTNSDWCCIHGDKECQAEQAELNDNRRID